MFHKQQRWCGGIHYSSQIHFSFKEADMSSDECGAQDAISMENNRRFQNVLSANAVCCI